MKTKTNLHLRKSRLSKKKTRKNKRMRKNKRGGQRNPITNVSELRVKDKYIIQFNNDEENDDIENTFSNIYNGTYKYIGWNTLSNHTNRYGPISYYTFQKNNLRIYLFHNDTPYEFNNTTSYFHILGDFHNSDDRLIPSGMTYKKSEDYFMEYRPIFIYCNVYPTYSQTDLFNTSTVSRLSNKTLPLDVERNIQTFITGKHI